jgi:hypothetical protein
LLPLPLSAGSQDKGGHSNLAETEQFGYTSR